MADEKVSGAYRDQERPVLTGDAARVEGHADFLGRPAWRGVVERHAKLAFACEEGFVFGCNAITVSTVRSR